MFSTLHAGSRLPIDIIRVVGGGGWNYLCFTEEKIKRREGRNNGNN
jgi:hypothetical protein